MKALAIIGSAAGDVAHLKHQSATIQEVAIKRGIAPYEITFLERRGSGFGSSNTEFVRTICEELDSGQYDHVIYTDLTRISRDGSQLVDFQDAVLRSQVSEIVAR